MSFAESDSGESAFCEDGIFAGLSADSLCFCIERWSVAVLIWPAEVVKSGDRSLPVRSFRSYSQ